jgi:FtsP/CotA-like multicopper oxidase with cupredoxin domain
MERREFLKYGVAGIASAGVGLSPLGAMAQSACQTCSTGGGTAAATFDLKIEDVKVRLIDGRDANMLGFGLAGGTGTSSSRMPGPVLRVREGTSVRITIRNDRQEWHGFEITGIPGTKTEIAPGCSCSVTFTAPAAGTYIYHDGYGNSPLYRILGLHGVLVVEPMNGLTAAGSRTPYSIDKLTALQRQSISALFDALGMTDRFLGDAAGKWVPAPSNQEYSNQEKIWVLSQIDPKFNALINPGKPILSNPALTSNVVGNFVPRYFTINGRSGYDLEDASDVVVKNYIGEPTLLRVVNAGLAHHANHIHGNHILELARVEGPDLYPDSPTYGRVTVRDNILESDVWRMWPLQRCDVLLPFEIPPDIPWNIPVSNPNQEMNQFKRMVKGQTQEPFPLRYVMHCHCEMSQTAAGGNYPQGMVTHFEILGGVGGRAAAAAG